MSDNESIASIFDEYELTSRLRIFHQFLWHLLHDSGPNNKVQECVFIPRSKDAAEGDGYIMSMVNRGDLPATELVILDTDRFDGPPVAVVRLPVVLKAGLHGNFVEAARLA